MEAITLSSKMGDFNDDLVNRSLDGLAAHVRVQLAPEDVSGYLSQGQLTRRTG